MWQSVAAISIGASAGALLRWVFSLTLNSIHFAVPLGTLTANLLGGYLIGLAVAFFTDHLQLAPEWRLLVVTGFLGGLTTFSTFSAEVVEMIQKASIGEAFITVLVHVVGSLALTFLGIWSYQLLKPHF
jgi:CrcB protein